MEGNYGNCGVYLINSTNTTITCSDFYNNIDGNFLASVPPALGLITNTNFNGTPCDPYFNIFEDPLFVNPDSNNFNLQIISPCIDAGDPNSPLDPDSTISDIGALYFNQNVSLSGQLSGILPDLLYLVINDIFILENDSLIIQPGATFLFNDNCNFNIYGYLSAIGTEADSIKFILNSGASNWGGINFDSTASDNSILEYCFITGSNSSAIYCNSSSPIFSHCTITDSYGDEGEGIACWFEANPSINYCLLNSNSSWTGGGIFCYLSSPTIHNCTFTGNSTEITGGGIYGGEGCGLIISNSIFYNSLNNSAIHLEYANNSQISYCDFYSNAGGSITGFIPDNFVLINSTNANGDFCDIYHIIFLDPKFMDVVNGYYHLQDTSPCIDAGDPNSPFDPDSTIADIGAFYFDQTQGVENPGFRLPPFTFSLAPPSPNPFNTTTQISFSIATAGELKLSIYDIQGREVAI